MATVGIDIGGTKLAAGVLEDGSLISFQQRPAPVEGYDALLTAITDVVATLADGQRIDAIGIGIAAWLSADRETVRRSANLGWDDRPLRADVAGRTGLPTVVVNDADAAAWASFIAAGRPRGTHITLTLGTDVGGGVIMDGRLVTGSNGIAGELGHIVLVPNGLPCVCGSHGCLATYASGRALLRRARELATEHPADFPILLARSGEADALTHEDVARAAVTATEGPALLEEAVNAIADTSAIVSRVIDHDTLMLTGGVTGIGESLRQAVEDAIALRPAIGPVRPVPHVLITPDADRAGVLGAADLARQT